MSVKQKHYNIEYVTVHLQKKQALQEEYNRTVAEEERRAAHRGPDTDLDYADRRHNLEKERHRDYQEYLATVSVCLPVVIIHINYIF